MVSQLTLCLKDTISKDGTSGLQQQISQCQSIALGTHYITCFFQCIINLINFHIGCTILKSIVFAFLILQLARYVAIVASVAHTERAIVT